MENHINAALRIVETTLTAILETQKWWKEGLIQQNQVLKFPKKMGASQMGDLALELPI